MDKDRLIDLLKTKIDTREQNGAYEIIPEILKALKKVNLSVIDQNDLNMLFYITLWNAHIDTVNSKIDISHLLDSDKENIKQLVNQYERSEIGFFGRATELGTTEKDAQRFIKMCLDITEQTDETKILAIAEKALDVRMTGIKAGIASQILYFVKPEIFPIMNSHGQEVYAKWLNLNLKAPAELTTYISNTRMILKFRNQNFKFKDLRVFDNVWENTVGRRYWRMSFKRGSQGPSFWEDCKRKNIAAIEWGSWSEEGGDCRNYTREQFRDAWDEIHGYNIQGNQNYKYYIETIGYEMKKGDIVYCKDGPKIVGKGEIVENYAFDPELEIICDNGETYIFPHYLKVNWESDFEEILISLGAEIRTILELKDERLNRLLKAEGAIMTPEKNIEVMESIPQNIILYGPPGTGKTYSHKLLVEAIENGKSIDEFLEALNSASSMENEVNFDRIKAEDRVEFITFHQSYSFEDFIEGYRPEGEGESYCIKLKDGIFKELAKKAKDNPDSNYYLIIDEINRGNIAKIFGELITLIEEDKRDKYEVKLPYSKETFSVPKNIYLIATMNTADKSIALLDVALRRRFIFIEMEPNLKLIDDHDDRALIETINNIIVEERGKDMRIGHSYFMQRKDSVFVFRYQIKPLLEEYFFGEKLEEVFEGHSEVLEALGIG